jgi:hypothetical protein
MYLSNLFTCRFLLKRLMSAWLTQVADPLVPNRILAFLENLKTGVFGKGFGIKSLQKALFGADSENLKMRRLPPIGLPTASRTIGRTGTSSQNFRESSAFLPKEDSIPSHWQI